MNSEDSNVQLNRIRILKTGLAHVERQFDMNDPDSPALLERIAVPGTELHLVRVDSDLNRPFRIDVYSGDGLFLGHVNENKSQTAARLMDAGFRLAAIVNESMPVHDSDMRARSAETTDDDGWSSGSRVRSGYNECHIPFCIYLEDRQN